MSSSSRYERSEAPYLHIFQENQDVLVPRLRREFPDVLDTSSRGARLFLGDEACLKPRPNVAAAAAASAEPDGSESSPSLTSSVVRARLPRALVSSEDCIECSYKHMLEDPTRRPLMKVFGSDRYPGGGARKGTSNVQDEHVNYVTPTLYPTLLKFYSDILQQQRRERRQGEPWLADAECIYVPSLPICRDQNLQLLDDISVTLDVLYLPGIRDIRLTANKKRLASADDQTLLDDKVRVWYRVCKWGGHRVPVSGLFNCGVFARREDRVHVAAIVIATYLRIVEEDEFAGCFDLLDFATLKADACHDVFAEACRAWNEINITHQQQPVPAAAAAASSESIDVTTDRPSKSQLRRMRAKKLKEALAC